MNATIEAYAEKMVRDEWSRKINQHGNSKCPNCGHSGWTHGRRGCVAFRSDTPTKLVTMGGIEVKVIDLPDDTKLEDYYCGCRSGLCKTNEQVIFGYDLPEVRNEPLLRYEGK